MTEIFSAVILAAYPEMNTRARCICILKCPEKGSGDTPGGVLRYISDGDVQMR